MSHLITSHQERLSRQDEKRQRVAAWLSAENFSDCSTLASVLGLTQSSALRTLAAMERDGLIKRKPFAHHRARLVCGEVKYVCYLSAEVWSLTMNGHLQYLRPDDDPLAFFDGQIKEATLRHALTLQLVRLAAEQHGWTEWLGDKMLKRQVQEAREANLICPWPKIADAISLSPAGVRTALELELTRKTTKRYEVIIADYLQMRKAGKVHEVHYLLESKTSADGLERLFRSIPSVNVRGTDIPLKEEHYNAFRFFSLSEWPSTVAAP